MAMINSILDQDIYKLTMQQSVLFGRFAGVSYQDIDVEYEFINRGGTAFPKRFARTHWNAGKFLQNHVQDMANLRLTDREYRWLKNNVPFLKRAYLEFLRGFRFDPNQVKVSQDQTDNLYIRITGPWYSAILWEVPLMALISELYFKMENKDHQNNFQIIREKAHLIQQSGLMMADFGTRRRHSYEVQDNNIKVLKEEAGPTFVGTSNVHFAMKYGLKAIGTHAHEFFMAHAALFGYRLANRYALQAWADEYQGDLGIALTDTFTTDVFFDQFDCRMAKLFDGLRQDSGDPIEFAKKAIAHYQKLGIDPMSKTIIFSDGLTIPKAIEIMEWCSGKIKYSFGIGTNITNDCGHKPLNMVIKMTKCNDIPVVKLSDVAGKHTGAPEAIDNCKFVFGLK